MIRLAFIGASGHFGYILAHLERFPEIRVVGCAPSFDGEDTTAYRELPDCAAYPTWQELLAEAQPHIVVVCGRHDRNAAIATAAAQQGCHIIAEKPAAISFEGLDALQSAVRASGVLYTMLLGMRYEPAWCTAHTLMRQGIIGAPLVISGQKSYRWGRRPDWYGDPTLYGSTMAWVGIHVFDLARWIGGVPFSQVAAQHANLAHPERPAAQDACAVLAALANGGSATFTLDYLRPTSAPTHGDDRLRIAGERGVIEVCDGGQRLSVLTHQRATPNWPLEPCGRSFLGDMLQAIEGSGSPLISAQQAWDITRFSLLAAQAADAGCWLTTDEEAAW